MIQRENDPKVECNLVRTRKTFNFQLARLEIAQADINFGREESDPAAAAGPKEGSLCVRSGHFILHGLKSN